MRTQGNSLTYVGGTTHRPLPRHDTPTIRPVITTRPRATGLDWAAITPTCPGCGARSSTVNAGTCENCRPRPTPKQPKNKDKKREKPCPTSPTRSAATSKTSKNPPTPSTHTPPPTAAAKKPKTSASPTPTANAPAISNASSPATSPTRPADVTPDQELDAQLQHALTVLRRAAQSTHPITQALRRSAIAALEVLHLFTELYDHQPPRPPQDTTTRSPRTPATRRRRNTSTPTDYEQAIIAAYQAGATPPKVAAAHGCTPKRVRAILDSHGIPRTDGRSNSGGRNKFNPTPEQTQQITRLYLDDQLSTTTIGNRLGVDRRVIRRILTDNNITIRPPVHHLTGTPITPELIADAAARYAAGESLDHIASHHHIKKTRLRDALTKHGVTIRGRGGNPGPSTPKGVTAADIRAWARANGHHCADRGRIPRDLIDAYTTAHPTPRKDQP